MIKYLKNRGFSFVELMVVIALISILSAIAVPQINKMYRTYKYIEYTSSMENLVRWAKITAMERSINVGLCVANNKTLRIVNMETRRSNICNGQDLNRLNINDAFVSLSGSGAAFDPRGFDIFNGNVCLTNGDSYYKVVISRFGAIRIQKGSGGC